MKGITHKITGTSTGKLVARVSWTERGQRRKARKTVSSRDEGALWIAQRTQALLEGREAEGSRAAQASVGGVLARTYELCWRGQKDEEKSLQRAGEVADLLGRQRSMSSITTQDVDEVRLELKKRGLKTSTVNRYMAALSRMIKVALDSGTVFGMGMPKVSRDREPEGRVRFLTRQEERALFQALPLHERALATFLVETGARVSEALRIKEEDVDLEQRVVHIRKTKGAKPRAVPLSWRALSTFSGSGEGSPYLLVAQSGQKTPYRVSPPAVGSIFKTTQKRLTRAWAAAKAKLGIEDAEVVPHCLRHTYATRLISAGVSVIDVQRMLGHASIETTMRYAHWAPENMNRVREALEVSA